MDKHVDPYAKVLLSDLIHEQQNDIESTSSLEELEKIVDEEGIDKCYADKEFCDKFKDVSMDTVNYEDLTMIGYNEAVVVVGGETEGVR